jgi:hypothetical protein
VVGFVYFIFRRSQGLALRPTSSQLYLDLEDISARIYNSTRSEYLASLPLFIIIPANLPPGVGGQDSTPVRGVPYEPAVLLGVSAELSLSRFESKSWC